MATVELQNISKSFDGQQVLSDLSLRVDDGEFLVLVGPSGCGKSTSLRLVAGLERPDAGAVWIGEKEVTTAPPRDRDIGMVFQSYALYPHLRVEENLAFGLRIRKVAASEIDERVKRIAGVLKLGGLLKRKPGQLSGGQRQRVAMGRAMIRNPQVYLFDEPLSNLDASLRTEMRAELANLHQRTGTTSIYVTHDQVEAMTLGTKIAVMKEGVVQQTAPPRELYLRPANAFVASFIGTPAMNFLDGRVRLESGSSWFERGGLKLALPERAVSGELHSSERVTLGVRPQQLRTGGGQLQGEVTLIEPTGWDVSLHCRVGEEALTVQVPAREADTLRVGGPVSLSLCPEQLYLFDSGGKTVVFPLEG